MKHSATTWLGVALLLLFAAPAAARTPPDQLPLCRPSAPAIEMPLGELRQQSQAGDYTATCLIGLKYLIGHGVKQDTDKAAHWLQQGAENSTSQHPSVATSMYYLAQMTIKGQGGIRRDPASATAWLRKAAQRGHLQAHVYLGLILAHGDGVAANPEQAVTWYRRAAELNYAPAMFYLGNAYEQGVGIAAHPAQATYWYQKSAELGLAEGQYNTGVRLLNGLGIAADPPQAMAWIQKAAQQGLQEARTLLVKIRSEQSPAVRAVGDRGSAPAPADDSRSQLSPPAATGNRQPSRASEPRRGVRAIASPAPKSLQQRHAELLKQVRQLLQSDGPNRKAADTTAFQILSTLADEGNPAAQFQLGELYQLGRGTAADISIAGLWYQRSARQGQAQAQQRLALIYAAGVGHPQNLLEAYIWLSLAVAQANNDAWRQQRDTISAQLSATGREQAQVEAQRRWNQIHAGGVQPAAPATP